MSKRLSWLIRPIAHRGLHDAARGVVENSSTAFAHAIESGYGIECDVRLCAGGEVVVFHDETLDRLTLATGPVAAKTPAELKAVAFRQGSDRIQTLGELLEQVCGRVPLVIELKSGWKEHGPLEARTAQLLKGYNGKAAVMSFDPFCIERFRGAAPELPRGLVACRFRDRQDWPMLNRWERFMMRHLLSAAVARPQFIAYDIEGLPSLAPWAARRIFRLPLLTWTVRTPEQRRRAQRHADAMIFEGFRP